MKNFIIISMVLIMVIGCNSKKNKEKQIDNLVKLKNLQTDLTTAFKRLEPKVIQPAEGYLKYPYLIPAGFYKQMWDWDGFFIGNHLASIGKPEYLKYWALNFIEGIDENGYVSGSATTKGPREIFGKFAMKPFLSQGVYFASVKMNDFNWIRSHYKALMKVLEYRDKTQLDTIYNLYFWDNAMQSGADNNPALNYFWKEDHRSFLSPDINTFQLREIIAQSLIAKKLGFKKDYKILKEKAAKLKIAINKYLWSEQDNIYYTVDRETGKFYKRVSYSSFIPLIQKLATQEKGAKMIRLYLINAEYMKAKYGFRSLSKKDPDYNNKNIIKPFSNWQGPVWPIANYLYHIGLKNYGFKKDISWMAVTMGNLLLNDINKWHSMHENYNADTGEPLAPAADYVDKDGNFVGFIGWNLCIQNVLEGVTQNKWMLLELPNN